MRVKALQRGYDGVKVRKKGEIFDWAKDKPAKWMVEVGASVPVSPAPKDEPAEKKVPAEKPPAAKEKAPKAGKAKPAVEPKKK